MSERGRGGRSGNERRRRDMGQRRDRDRDRDRDREKRRNKVEEKRPTILAKPLPETDQRNIDFPTLQQAVQQQQHKVRSPPRRTPAAKDEAAEVVKEVSSPVPAAAAAAAASTPAIGIAAAANKTLLNSEVSSSPTTSAKPVLQQQQQQPSLLEYPIPDRRYRFIDENQSFCDGISDFLTDYADFLVIGAFGPQNAGKSSFLNSLIGADDCPKDPIFRVQSFEKQMLGERCTNGINVWISPRRIIFLDCQGINAPSILNHRMIQNSKYNAEFTSLENTLEIYSLQLAGFLMTVCHALIFVEDYFVDPELIRFIRTAEMLKPSSPASEGGEDSSNKRFVEYFPKFILLHNKAHLDDLTMSTVKTMTQFYETIFDKSQLSLNDRLNNINEESDFNLFLLPDTDNEDGIQVSYQDMVDKLRRKIFSLPRHQMTTTKLTEKTWLHFAQKSWENVKNCQFYMEYNRFLL